MGRASLQRSSGGGLAADGSGRCCYVWNRGLGLRRPWARRL